MMSIDDNAYQCFSIVIKRNVGLCILVLRVVFECFLSVLGSTDAAECYNSTTCDIAAHSSRQSMRFAHWQRWSQY